MSAPRPLPCRPQVKHIFPFLYGKWPARFGEERRKLCLFSGGHRQKREQVSRRRPSSQPFTRGTVERRFRHRFPGQGPGPLRKNGLAEGVSRELDPQWKRTAQNHRRQAVRPPCAERGGRPRPSNAIASEAFEPAGGHRRTLAGMAGERPAVRTHRLLPDSRNRTTRERNLAARVSHATR